MMSDLKPTRCLTEEQVTKLLMYAFEETPAKYFMVLFLLLTGVRVGEATHLRWADLFEDTTVMSWFTVRGEWTKSGSSRNIPVSDRLKEALLKHAALCGAKTVYWPNLDYPLFPGHKKEGWSIRQIQRHIHEMGQNALGMKVTPHMLRHTFATRLLKVTDLRTVQIILGHVSITSTQIYLNPSMQDLKSAVDKLVA